MSSNRFENKRRFPRPNYFETWSTREIWNELILCIKLYKKI